VVAAKWNGITLTYYFTPHKWYDPDSGMKIYVPEPLVTYTWYECDREYRPVENSKTPTYKWTRHFLVEKSAPAGSGEWICEGDIPEPAVFMLQLYRTYKMTDSEAHTKDIKALPAKLSTAISPIIIPPLTLSSTPVTSITSAAATTPTTAKVTIPITSTATIPSAENKPQFSNGANNIKFNNKPQYNQQPPEHAITSPRSAEVMLHTEALEMFTKYTEHGSEQIDSVHFVSLMHEVKPGLSEAELKLAFELMDSNNDSLIDMNEFCDWFAELKEWGNETD